jgi:hypothetical protein
MELTFIFFLFSALISISGIFFMFALYRKYLAGSIASIGLLVFFTLFGIQTFNPDGTYVISSSDSMTNWPPVINFCPDFLPLLKINDTSGNPTFICVDTVGVSTDGTGIQKYNPNNNVVGTPSVNNNQTFNLYLQVSSVTDRLNSIIGECKTKKVTWQGIFDGIAQLNTTVPMPPNIN